MTAWMLGPIVGRVEPLSPSTMEVALGGPHVVAVRLRAKHNDSDYCLTISLARGCSQVDFTLDVNWLERGDPAAGGIEGQVFDRAGIARPFVQRLARGGVEKGEDALAGATLVNNCKYGHQLGENGMRLTLLRSSLRSRLHQNLLRLVLAQSQMVAAHLDFNRVAQRSKAHQLNRCAFSFGEIEDFGNDAVPLDTIGY